MSTIKEIIIEHPNNGARKEEHTSGGLQMYPYYTVNELVGGRQQGMEYVVVGIGVI